MCLYSHLEADLGHRISPCDPTAPVISSRAHYFFEDVVRENVHYVGLKGEKGKEQEFQVWKHLHKTPKQHLDVKYKMVSSVMTTQASLQFLSIKKQRHKEGHVPATKSTLKVSPVSL